jgi:hypothetical protein
MANGWQTHAGATDMNGMRHEARNLFGVGSLLWLLPLVAWTQQPGCDEKVAVHITVDRGHPWRPPFGIERVASPIMVRVTLKAESPPQRKYAVVAREADRPGPGEMIDVQFP